jgi:hypothetical protein
MKPEDAARLFHETYERLAPEHGYRTREASAVPWEDVPEPNRSLMIAVAGEVGAEIERQVRAKVIAEIEEEAADMDPDREAKDADHLPGLAGNSYWRAMCEANGLWRAVNVVRGQS